MRKWQQRHHSPIQLNSSGTAVGGQTTASPAAKPVTEKTTEGAHIP
jgi:hypothetical protein